MVDLVPRQRERSIRGLGALLGLSALSLLLVVSGCKSKPAPDPAAPAESALGGDAPAPAPAAKPKPARCVAPKEPKTFDIVSRTKGDAEGEVGVDLPFSTEIGDAAATSSGFAVGALRYDDGKPQALVFLGDREGKESQLVELGVVHGLADAPAVATRGDRAFAAVVSSDAAGPTLRLARMDVASLEVAPGSLTWGGTVQQGTDDSSAFALAVGASEGGIVVWDDYDPKTKHAVVRAATFRGDDVDELSAPRVLSPPDADAEAPSVVARPGGYWLAWLSSVAPKKDDEKLPSPAQATRNEDEAGSVVELVPRGLSLMPLDSSGAPAHAARTITAPLAHVVAFELAASPDGSAVLAWRDDPTAPGAEGRAMQLAWVLADGSVRTQRLDDERFAAGAPALAVDPKGPVWLAASGEGADVLLGTVGPSSVSELLPEPALASKQVLSVFDGRLLYVEPRGRGATLGVLRCAPPAP